MQKDRYIFALIIYGVVLLTAATVCSFVLSKDVFAVANTGTMSGQQEHSGVTGTSPTPIVPSNAVTQQLPAPTDTAKNPGQSESEEEAEVLKVDPWELLSVETTQEWRTAIGTRCIVLPKPEAAIAEQEIVFSLSDMPMERSIALEFQGCAEINYDYATFERIADGQYFDTEPIEDSADPLKEIKQRCTLLEDGSYQVYMELLLDKTYVYNVYEAESYYFISLTDAKDAYDRIVVLDAGHGGWDTGTASYDGQYLEKDINLQVMQYLEELLRQEDIKVYTTRTTDRNVGHTERIRLANDLGADMFISIHCNNVYQNPDAHGTEVLYTQYQDSWTGMNSKKLAQICLEELLAEVQLSDRGLFARGDDLTVLQQAEVPATIVELAFMSNVDDMALLKKEETQRSAAKALYQAILRGYEESGKE